VVYVHLLPIGAEIDVRRQLNRRIGEALTGGLVPADQRYLPCSPGMCLVTVGVLYTNYVLMPSLCLTGKPV